MARTTRSWSATRSRCRRGRRTLTAMPSIVEETAAADRDSGQRDVDFDRMRYWKVINRRAKNWVGSPPATSSRRGSPVKPFTHPDSPSGRRGRFIQHQLVGDALRPGRALPGRRIRQSIDGGVMASRRGLATDRPIENTDIVLWHSFGLHHLPRPEDHPVQTCVVCGFTLAPIGFFDQNPVIDLPSQTNEASSCAHCA